MRPLPDFYSPGQLSVVVPHCNFTPEWLLLGGPADGNEAQTARAFWPRCRVLAYEPNPEAYRWQCENVREWSDDDSGMVLSRTALADHTERVDLAYEAGKVRNAGGHAEHLEPNRKNPAVTFVTVPATTLDLEDRVHGPVANAVLWLDVEGAELPAVRGAAGLLGRGAVRLVNVEVVARRAENAELRRLLEGYGFRFVKRWNNSKACEDQIWVLDVNANRRVPCPRG